MDLNGGGERSPIFHSGRYPQKWVKYKYLHTVLNRISFTKQPLTSMGKKKFARAHYGSYPLNIVKMA